MLLSLCLTGGRRLLSFFREEKKKKMPRNKKQGIALPIQMLLVAPLSLRLARVLVKG